MDISGCRRQRVAALVLLRFEEEGHFVCKEDAQSCAMLEVESKLAR
jgi:hypothetical protein